MRPAIAFPACLLALCLAVVTSCGRSSRGPHGQAQSSLEPAVDEADQSTNAGRVVSLSEAAQRRMGLVTAIPEVTTLPREVKAYGLVLDPMPLLSLTAESASARATLEASTRELQRTKNLFDLNQNASQRSLEAAEATVQRDRLATNAVWLKLTTGWGKQLTERSDLPSFVESLARFETVLVRLDLAAGEELEEPLTAARLTPMAGSGPSTAVEIIGPAPSVASQTQGQGFLGVVHKPEGLRPGQTILGFLAVGGEPLEGVRVSQSAVVRADGRAWVYVADKGDRFRRQAVTLDSRAVDGWLITEGLSTEDRVVVAGAQLLLSEERKGRLEVSD